MVGGLEKHLRIRVTADASNFKAEMKAISSQVRTLESQQKNAAAGFQVSEKGIITSLKTKKRIDRDTAVQMTMNHKRTMAMKNAEIQKQREINRANREMRGILLGLNLSLMFLGMQLQRTFGGITRSILNTYEQATEGNTAFNKSSMQLRAGWEFLKFSIANALNQPGIISFIDKIITIVDRIADWINETEHAGAIIFGVFAALAGVGGVLFFFNQIALSWFATMAFMTASSQATMGASGPIAVTARILAKTVGGLLVAGFTICGDGCRT